MTVTGIDGVVGGGRGGVSVVTAAETVVLVEGTVAGKLADCILWESWVVVMGGLAQVEAPVTAAKDTERKKITKKID